MAKCARAIEVAVIAALALGLWGGPARATTMLYLSIDDLSQRSDAVVRGTIQGHQSYWTDQGQMLTDWTLAVSEVLSGTDVPPVLTIQQMGGTVGDRTMHIPGDAVLSDGEHVVLFLVVEDGVWYLTALGQSKLAVSAQGGLGTPGTPLQVDLDHTGVGLMQATLVRDLSDIVFYQSGSNGQLYHVENELLTLDALRRDLAPVAVEGGAP